MLDLMNLNAASWDATPIHDLYFEDDLELDESVRPSQFAKWLIEKDNNVNVNEASPGEFFKMN